MSNGTFIVTSMSSRSTSVNITAGDCYVYINMIVVQSMKGFPHSMAPLVMWKPMQKIQCCTVMVMWKPQQKHLLQIQSYHRDLWNRPIESAVHAGTTKQGGYNSNINVTRLHMHPSTKTKLDHRGSMNKS